MSSFITSVDRCSSVFNASFFLMNESILLPLSNPTNEADSTEFHFTLVIVTGLLSSCVCVAPHSYHYKLGKNGARREHH